MEAFETLRERVGPDAVFAPPPGGWCLPFAGGLAVLEAHATRERCLVFVTALSEGMAEATEDREPDDPDTY